MQFKASSLFFAILVSSFFFNLATSFCDKKTPNDINLDLSHVGIKRLPPKFVSSESVTCLNLKGNDIEHIDENAFAGLPNLTDLNLEGSSTNFETFRSYNFPKLRTLVVDRTSSSRYRDSQFYYTEPPTTRYYYGHSRTHLRPKYEKLSYISLPLLEELSMCNYSASETVDLLKKFDVPNLQRLRLNGNGLTDDMDLPETIVRNLTDLQLNENQISRFSGLNLLKVRNLTLNDNKVRKLCAIYCDENSMTIHTMVHLESLSMMNNKINEIDTDAFANSAQLVSLNLAENSIAEFPSHAFDGLKKLQYLTLDHNRLEQIPDICALTELRELSIDGNSLTSIDAGSFCGLEKLTSVSLKRNGLIEVTSETFGKPPMLKRLDLSWNSIRILPENWAKSGSEIEELNLDGNKFIDVSHMSLAQFKSLKYLSMRHNPFGTIKIGSLINLPADTTLDVNHVCGNENIPTTTDPYEDYQ